MTAQLVVVGAGQAGAELAFAARQHGWSGTVTVVGDEPHPPYQRPPLSKALLRGDDPAGVVPVRAPEAYERAGITVLTGTPVVRIDRDGAQVQLADGRRLPWTALALATGGRPRRLPWADAVAGQTLHTVEEARHLLTHLRPGARLLLVGGGFIGLEAASAAALAGARVVVVEAQSRLLARTCPAVVADALAAVHRAHGVDVRTGTSVVSAQRTPDGVLVHLDDGDVLVVDHVLVGIGQDPDDALAAAAGLAVDDGVLVDEQARTSDPRVVAAGDCTRQLHGHLGVRVRLQSQQNAGDQARIAARTVCGLDPAPPTVPWFWSDQYDLALRIAGVAAAGDDEVVRGRAGAPGFSVLTLRDQRLTSIQSLSSPRDFAAGRRLLAGHARVDPAAAADPDRPLAALPASTSMTATDERPAPCPQ